MNIQSNISVIDLSKVDDYSEALEEELIKAFEQCKKIDDFSYYLPCRINEIKDDILQKINALRELRAEIAVLMTSKKNVYDDYVRYLDSKK